MVGVGTETDGSIICPASVSGLVGLEAHGGPGVSRSGIIPISISQDTAGPMARTVADAALLHDGARRGGFGDDPAGPAAEGHVTDYLSRLKPDALKGKRFGVLREAMGYHPAVDASMGRRVATLTAAGARWST